MLNTVISKLPLLATVVWPSFILFIHHSISWTIGSRDQEDIAKLQFQDFL